MQSNSSMTEALFTQALLYPEERGRLLEHCTNYLRLLATSQFDRRVQARVGASDIVQETLLEAHRDFPHFRGKTSAEFLSWLRQILVHNLARTIDCHVIAGKRDVRRERTFELLNDSVQASSQGLARLLPDQGTSPSVAVLQQEELLVMADALSDLRREHYEVIRLRHLEGLSFREVAERMERSEGAVRMLWFRAMEQLRKILGEKGML